jgi:hypothetical protein
MKSLVQRQAESYERVINAMRLASGIRRLVVITDGLALSQDVAAMIPVARAAAQSGVQLSVLMATPDISLADNGRQAPPAGQTPQADRGAPQRRREDNQLLLSGARTAADMTGGDFYQITGDADRFFARVERAASAIYRIAVEAPADARRGRDFTLSVRVPKQPGVRVHANRYAVAAAAWTSPSTGVAPAAATRLMSTDEQMRRAIASGRSLQGLDVAIDHTVRRAADPAQVAIDIVVRLPVSARPPLDTIFALVDATGAMRTSKRRFDTTAGPDGFRLSLSVPVVPGAYALRFAAADASGDVGATESPVDATLLRMGPLTASGVITQMLPAPARTLLAAIELYPSGPPAADVLVNLALLSTSSEVIAERVVVPDAVDGVLRAEAEFALDRLPAGTYTVRATVLSGATVLGTATHAIR